MHSYHISFDCYIILARQHLSGLACLIMVSMKDRHVIAPQTATLGWFVQFQRLEKLVNNLLKASSNTVNQHIEKRRSYDFGEY